MKKNAPALKWMIKGLYTGSNIKIKVDNGISESSSGLLRVRRAFRGGGWWRIGGIKKIFGEQFFLLLHEKSFPILRNFEDLIMDTFD